VVVLKTVPCDQTSPGQSRGSRQTAAAIVVLHHVPVEVVKATSGSTGLENAESNHRFGSRPAPKCGGPNVFYRGVFSAMHFSRSRIQKDRLLFPREDVNRIGEKSHASTVPSQHRTA
jgi:hypothetical protein